MKRRISKKEWRRRRRLKRIMFMIISVVILLFLSKELWGRYGFNNIGKDTITHTLSGGEVIKVEFLTPNPYSRPQNKLRRVNGIVVHYTANPGASAENNRNYFEGLATTKETSASSHYIIGLKGEIIQCIPLTEISYASNNRNDDTISIECCHPDKTGKFNEATYKSLVSLSAALCREYKLNKKDVIRHYDVTGKLCPLYFIEHENAWEKFKEDVMDEVEIIKNDENTVK